MTRNLVVTVVGTLALLVVAIQLVPYRVHNGPVVQEPAWDNPQTRALAARACFDCHSNEVVTPWYGHVAPVAWVVRHHVDEGRAALNLSEMHRPQEEAHEAGESIRDGEMPPRYYLPLHAGARLTDAERLELAAGLQATLGGEEEGSDDGSARHGHDDHG